MSIATTFAPEHSGAASGDPHHHHDVELLNSILKALDAVGHPELRGLQVTLNRGVVLLRGRVPSYYLKQTAQTTILPVAGVRAVANEILVTSRPEGTSSR